MRGEVMKASEFIVHLQQMIEEHGDLPLALMEGVGCDTSKCVYIEVVDTEGVVRLSDEDEFFNADDEKVKVDKVFLID